MSYERQPHLSRRWDDELYHFGIRGQKKGIRRFQNLDRTWTEAGKIRYGRGGSHGAKSKSLDEDTKRAIREDTDGIKSTTSQDRLAKAIKEYAKANGVSEKDVVNDLSGRIYIDDFDGTNNIRSSFDNKPLKDVTNTNSLKTRWEISKQQAKQNRDFMFGNKKNDLTEIDKEFYKEIRKQKKAMDHRYDSQADFYYYNKDIINKYVDKYSKQLLKNMGYNDDDKSVKWLKSQKWYKVPNEFFNNGLLVATS